MQKKTIAVLFGGKSPEHEVSIITGIQVLLALNKSKYDVLPIYVTKEGQWVLGDNTFFNPETFKDPNKATEGKQFLYQTPDPNISLLERRFSFLNIFESLRKLHIDVFFPAFHGRYGEDGAIQGVFEMSGAAYVGCGVEASAICMDKVVSKRIAESLGIPVLESNWCTKPKRGESLSSKLKNVSKGLGFPVFVKPVRLGSSIGLKRARSMTELIEAAKIAFFYDTKLMIEKELKNAKEINISLLGNNPYIFSECEQPVSSGKVLSFKDKYLSKNGPSKGMASAKRIIPAPIRQSTKKRIEEYAERFFGEIGGEGIARADFLVSEDEKNIYFNEVNTMPGSVAFYLWDGVGVPFNKLVDKLVDLAISKKEEDNKLITTFKSNILEGYSGAKASKVKGN